MSTCLTCGLCCLAEFEDEPFVDLDSKDVRKLEDRDLAHLVQGDAIPTLKVKSCRPKKGPFREFIICACIALRGDPLHKVRCSIYEDRPRACREAVREGAPECLQIKEYYEDFLEKEAMP